MILPSRCLLCGFLFVCACGVEFPPVVGGLKYVFSEIRFITYASSFGVGSVSVPVKILSLLTLRCITMNF